MLRRRRPPPKPKEVKPVVERRAPVLSRFWEKVNKNGPVPAHSPELGPCWVWTASLRKDTQYGQFRLGNRIVNAHKFAYEAQKGPIPPGMYACHKCDNRQCCNPNHMYAGTMVENMLEASLRGRLHGQHRTKRKVGQTVLTPQQRERLRARREQTLSAELGGS